MPRDDSTQVFTFEDDNLPPRDLWPTYVHSIPELAYPQAVNLAETLLARAAADPGRVAIRYRGENVSYASLRQRTLAFARGLADRGVKPNDRVGLRLANSPEFVAAWLAIQWLGAIGVPIPTAYRRRELVNILDHSGA